MRLCAQVCAPFARSLQYLFYRRDVLAQRRLRVPNTWEELVEVAQQLNGESAGAGPCLCPCLLRAWAAAPCRWGQHMLP